MKTGDLVRHKTASTLGLGLVTGLKPRSSGVYVRWLNTRTGPRATQEIDIMLEVVSK